jgi:hypothetical protein
VNNLKRNVNTNTQTNNSKPKQNTMNNSKRIVNTNTQTNNSKPKQNTMNNSKRIVNTNTQTNNSKPKQNTSKNAIINIINVRKNVDPVSATAAASTTLNASPTTNVGNSRKKNVVPPNPPSEEVNDAQNVFDNYKVSNTAPDGNCLFRSIVKGQSLLTPPHVELKDLRVEKIKAQKLRENAVNFLCGNNKNKYIKELSNNHLGQTDLYSMYKNEKETKFENWDDYCREMKKPGIWGGTVELYFIPRLINRPIKVYALHNNGFIFRTSHYKGLNDTNKKKEPIRLLHRNNNHFDLLVKKTTKTNENGAPELLKRNVSRKLFQTPKNTPKKGNTNVIIETIPDPQAGGRI